MDVEPSQHRRNNVIRIYVPVQTLISMYVRRGERYIPFASLQIADPVLLHERVACTYTGDNTRGGIVLRGLVIDLIYSMEVRTTADDLETHECNGQNEKSP